jgi:hypothetical protein
VDIIYLRSLLRNMGILQVGTIGYTQIFEDNNACIKSSSNIIGGRKLAKHKDIGRHFTHEAIQSGHLGLIRVSTS